MMPDLNGDEVLKLIKSDPDKRDIPVVMISADTDAEKVSQCIELGADDYLPKPFNPTIDRKSTRLNSSHSQISYAVFCLKKKKKTQISLISHYAAYPPNYPRIV